MNNVIYRVLDNQDLKRVVVQRLTGGKWEAIAVLKPDDRVVVNGQHKKVADATSDEIIAAVAG